MATVTALGTPPVITCTSAFGAQLPFKARSGGAVQAIETEEAKRDKNTERTIRRTFVFMALLHSVKLRWPFARGRGRRTHSSSRKVARLLQPVRTPVHFL